MSTSSRDDAIAIPRQAVRRAAMALLGLLAIAVVIVLAVYIGKSVSGSDPLASAINANEYQYVRLTNGESYFGKLSAPGGEFYYLRHVYSLALVPAASRGKPLRNLLVPLASQVHAPEDLLVI